MQAFGKSIVIAALLATGATAAVAADASRGGELARRWCAACHLVAPDQATANASAAPFASVAEQPDFDARDLAISLLAPHPQMPDRGLSRDDAKDIVAYIRSLKK